MEQGLLISCLDAQNLAEGVRVAHGIGYRNCEISVCPGDARPNLVDLADAERREILKLIADLGMRVSAVQCHVHNGYADASESVRRKAVDHTRRMIDLCASLGIGCLHTVSGVAEDDAPHEEKLDRLAACYREILASAGDGAPEIGLEPVFLYVVGNLAHTRSLYERLGELPLQINFDPGHFVYHDESCIPFIEAYGDRIIHAHSKDAVVEPEPVPGSDPNHTFPTPDGKGFFRFMPPGDGVLPWDDVIEALKKVGFDGVVSLEMGHGYPGPPEKDARKTYAFFRDTYGIA